MGTGYGVTLVTGCMPRTWHGHSQVGTSAQVKGSCFQPMRTTSDFLGAGAGGGREIATTTPVSGDIPSKANG